MQLVKGTVGYQILFQLLHVSEFPFQSLHLLGHNQHTATSAIRRLKEAGYLIDIGSIKHRSIRLSAKGVSEAKELFGDFLYNYHQIVTNERHRKSENSIVWRKFRDAEVTIMMLNNHVNILPHDKPQLFFEPQYFKTQLKKDKCFYSSREIKQLDILNQDKYLFTRMKGLYFSPGGIYMVYNIYDGPIRWYEKSEDKVQLAMSEMVKQNFQNMKEFKAQQAIIFGKDWDTAAQVISNKKKTDARNEYELFSFDKTFQDLFYIPLNEEGQTQLQLLSYPQWNHVLVKGIIPSKFREKDSMTGVDGVDSENKKNILIFCDGNVSRLNRVLNLQRYMTNTTLEIIGFPWQMKFLIKTCEAHPQVIFKQIEPTHILNLFNRED